MIATLKECLQKPDQFPALHIALHAAAVIIPTALTYYYWFAPGISVATWGLVFLVFGGHGKLALGGVAGAMGISVALGALVAAAGLLGPWGAWAGASLAVAALAWAAEYHQNAGEWCGQDVPNLHNRLKGAGIGSLIGAVILTGVIQGAIA